MAARWRWVDLGGVDGPTMVNLFVALAEPIGTARSPPTVLFLHPSAPFANVGFHQEAERELDLEYCRAHGVPVVRRVVGGGAILDGPWEQDYMLIVPAGSPGTEGGVAGFYERYLAPVRATLGRLGVPAERSGVNDLAAGGRKVSANGALTLDESWVLVGDLLLDLDVAAMSRVLRVPDEKFRGKLASGMDEWLTSVRRLTGRSVPREEVGRILREEIERAFAVTLVPGPLRPEETERLDALRRLRTTDDWTFQKDRAHPDLAGGPDAGHAIKISAEATLARYDLKAGKLLRVTLLHDRGAVREVQFAGDFFTQPFDGHLADLEAGLRGLPLSEPELAAAIRGWLERRNVQLLGAAPEDLARAVVGAAALRPSSS